MRQPNLSIFKVFPTDDDWGKPSKPKPIEVDWPCKTCKKKKCKCEPIEKAFNLLRKAPTWTLGDDESMDKPPSIDWGRYPDILADLIGATTENDTAWESKEGDARGVMRSILLEQEGEEDYDSAITNFTMAADKRGQGLSRERLQEFIDDVSEWGTAHVTNVERDKIDYWNKLVNEGLIESASDKSYVRQTPDGEIKRLIDKAFDVLRKEDGAWVFGYDRDDLSRGYVATCPCGWKISHKEVMGSMTPSQLKRRGPPGKQGVHKAASDHHAICSYCQQ